MESMKRKFIKIIGYVGAILLWLIPMGIITDKPINVMDLVFISTVYIIFIMPENKTTQP